MAETWHRTSLRSLLPEITAFTERLRFNVLYRGPQKFAWTEFRWRKSKPSGTSCETSVNDVILALVTATIRRYLELHGDRVKGQLLRMMVPVNLRGSDSPSENWETASPWFRSPSRWIFATRGNCWRPSIRERSF